jgi:hypothetical protein
MYALSVTGVPPDERDEELDDEEAEAEHDDK